MYTQDFDPISDSLGLTSIFAVLPLVTLFILLGGVKMKAQWASLIALGVAMIVALAVYGMPFGQTALSASEGATFGLFPIMWIVVTAIWVYNMTVETGHFAVLRRSFGAISEDQRVQAVIVAFCFGALMEALAGFGTPVAISAVMLIALGFRPIKAASIALVANTAPVAFGAIAIPITTLSEVTGLDKGDLGAMVGRQTPFLALVVPLILIGMVDGRRGIRQAWPVAVVGGVSFALAQFACSNYISVELTDIVAVARRRRPASSASCASGRPASRSWRRPTGASPPGRGRRLGARLRDGEGDRAPRRHPQGSAARRGQGVRALPDHHRRVLDRADRGDQGLRWRSRRGRPPSRGRAGRAKPRRRAAHEPDVQLQLAARRRHADADLGPDHDGRARALARARAARGRRGRSTSSSGRS